MSVFFRAYWPHAYNPRGTEFLIDHVPTMFKPFECLQNVRDHGGTVGDHDDTFAAEGESTFAPC